MTTIARSTVRKARALTTEELEARALDLSRRHDEDEEIHGALEGVVPIRLGSEWLALPVTAAHEVLRKPVVTPVFHVPPFVAGMANLRGEVLWVLDLRVMLNMPPAPATAPFAVVVRDGGLDALVLADTVAHVEWLPVERRRPVLGTVPEEVGRFFQGMHRGEDGTLLTCLALDQVLNHDALIKLREA